MRESRQLFTTRDVAKGRLESGREMCIKKVLHHLLVCRTAVSVVFALKSGDRGVVEEGTFEYSKIPGQFEDPNVNSTK